jgi:hypothetical protein
MIRIPVETKDHFLVKLESGCQAAQVDGYRLTGDMAAEIGFEKITTLMDVIEDTRHLEDLNDGWSVYLIQWTERHACACGKESHTKQASSFTRVYVRKIKQPKGDD